MANRIITYVMAVACILLSSCEVPENVAPLPADNFVRYYGSFAGDEFVNALAETNQGYLLGGRVENIFEGIDNESTDAYLIHVDYQGNLLGRFFTNTDTIDEEIIDIGVYAEGTGVVILTYLESAASGEAVIQLLNLQLNGQSFDTLWIEEVETRQIGQMRPGSLFVDDEFAYYSCVRTNPSQDTVNVYSFSLEGREKQLVQFFSQQNRSLNLGRQLVKNNQNELAIAGTLLDGATARPVEVFFIRMDESGRISDKDELAGNSIFLNHLYATRSDEYLMSGTVTVAGESDIYFRRLSFDIDDNDVPTIETTFNFPDGNDEGIGSVRADDLSVILVANSSSQSIPDSVNISPFKPGAQDIALLKVNGQNQLQLVRLFGSQGSEEARAIIKDSQGKIVVAGNSEHLNNNSNIMLIKVDENLQ